MILRVAVQMDPLSKLTLQSDTTVELVRAAHARGHEVFVYTPLSLSLRDGRVMARGTQTRPGRFPWESEDIKKNLFLENFQLVLVRQDPPFDMPYLTTLYFLERLEKKTLVINSPRGICGAPEKIFPTVFSSFMPPTLITASKKEAEKFLEEHKDIVLKPLYGHGGRGVLRLGVSDPNTQTLLEMITDAVVLQKYVPDVKKGDVRVIFVDGEAVASLNRVPAAGQLRANLRTGARAELGTLGTQERSLCEVLGAELKARGLFLAGADIIGGFLTEVNVTSPTGLCEIKALGGANVAVHFWEILEKKFFS